MDGQTKIKIENVSSSFAGKSSDNTANFESNRAENLIKQDASVSRNLKPDSFDDNNIHMTLGKEESAIKIPTVNTTPKRLEKKNMFGGNKSDAVSGGASSYRKRSRIVDKTGEVRNLAAI